MKILQKIGCFALNRQQFVVLQLLRSKLTWWQHIQQNSIDGADCLKNSIKSVKVIIFAHQSQPNNAKVGNF